MESQHITFKDIKLEESLKDEFKTIKHAAHILLWFNLTEDQRQETVGQIDCSKNFANAYGLMQMRSDGKIGFPGGYVSSGEFSSFFKFEN